MLAKIGIVGGSVVLFAGMFVLGYSSATAGSLDAACVRGTCPRSQQDRIDLYNTELLYGGVGALTGLVMIGVGVLLYKFAIPPQQPTTGAWLLTPTGVGGRF